MCGHFLSVEKCDLRLTRRNGACRSRGTRTLPRSEIPRVSWTSFTACCAQASKRVVYDIFSHARTHRHARTQRREMLEHGNRRTPGVVVTQAMFHGAVERGEVGGAQSRRAARRVLRPPKFSHWVGIKPASHKGSRRKARHPHHRARERSERCILRRVGGIVNAALGQFRS